MNAQWRANIGLALEVSFLGGVVWGAWIDAALLGLVGSLIMVCVASVFVSWRLALVIILSGIVLSAGVWYAREHVGEMETVQSNIEERELTLTGSIVSYPQEKSDAFVYVVRVLHADEVKLGGENIRVYDRSPTPRFQYGDRVTVKGEVTVPTKDGYRRYLASTGEAGVMYRPHLTPLEEGNCSLICVGVRSVFQLRTTLLQQVRVLMPGIEGEFVKGLLAGHDDRVPQTYETAFQRTGITHLLAISGYHVTILLLVVRQVFHRLGMSVRWQLLTTFVLLAGFVVFIGFHGSVVRASIFLALVLTAQSMGRYFSGVRALVLAAFGMALMSPLFVAWNIAFQLSLVAAFGIFSLVPALSSLWLAHDWKAFLGSILLETLAAELFVLPLIMHTFGMISVISPLANLVIVPVIPPLMAGSLGVALLSGLPGVSALAPLLAYPIQALVDVGLTVIRLLADLPFSAFEVPQIGWTWVLLSYVLLGVVTWITRQYALRKYVTSHL